MLSSTRNNSAMKTDTGVEKHSKTTKSLGRNMLYFGTYTTRKKFSLSFTVRE